MGEITVVAPVVEGEIVQAEQTKDWWSKVHKALIDNLRSAHSRKAYTDSLERFFIYIQKLPPDVEKQDVIDFREHLHAKGQKNASVNRHLAAVRSFYHDALLDGHVSVNPAASVKSLETSSDGTTAAISPAQYYTLLSVMNDRTLEGARNKALFLMLVWTGIRIAECMRLTIADISEQQGFWTVRVMRKGGRTQYVVLEERAYLALTHWLQMAEITSGPIWINLRHYGRREGIQPDAVRRILEELGLRAGMSLHLHPHMLRTTFINFAFDGGAPLEKIQHAAGHADPRTTLRYKRAKDNLTKSASSYIKL